MRTSYVELSKTVSHALRHEPETYGICLDAEGWVDVDMLLASLRRQRIDWMDLEDHDLVEMIERSSKRRHEMRDGRIRALYGHSASNQIARPHAIPPSVLFHATTPEAAPLIEERGLLPLKRQHVHLARDERRALSSARRKTRLPILFDVLSAQAHVEGVRFYKGNDEVWLADFVPVRFLVRQRLG